MTAILLLVLVAPLVLMLSRQGRGTVSLLVWYLLWLGDLVFKAMPHLVFWILFLCAALAIALASLVRRRTQIWHRPAVEPSRAGRVRSMARAVRRTDQGDYFKWRLARYLGELAAETAVDHGRVPADERLARLRGMAAEIPPEILDYLELGLGRGLLEPTSLSARIRQWLRSDPRPSPLDLDPGIVVRFLEEQLEVTDDR